MQNLSAPFIFQEECRMKIEHALFPCVSVSKLRIRVSEGHFQCVHMIRFSEPTKIRSLKTDRVNGSLYKTYLQGIFRAKWLRGVIAYLTNIDGY